MIKITIRRVINLPVEQVWKRIRPFDSLSDWHPYVDTCIIENDEAVDKLGVIREIVIIDDGGYARETLIALSDADMSITYDIIDSSMPVENYVSRIDLYEVTEGDKTFANWSTEFDTDKENEAEMIELLKDIYRKGLEGLDAN